MSASEYLLRSTLCADCTRESFMVRDAPRMKAKVTNEIRALIHHMSYVTLEGLLPFNTKTHQRDVYFMYSTA